MSSNFNYKFCFVVEEIFELGNTMKSWCLEVLIEAQANGKEAWINKRLVWLPMLWLATNIIQWLGAYELTLIGYENYHNILWLIAKTIRRLGLHKWELKRVTDGLTYTYNNNSGYASLRQVATNDFWKNYCIILAASLLSYPKYGEGGIGRPPMFSLYWTASQQFIW